MTTKADQIQLKVDKINLRIDKMKEGIARAMPRIETLGKEGYYIEAAILHSQIIEHAIKMILLNFEDRKDIYQIVGETDPKANLKLPKDLNIKPLGTLIDQLDKFVGASHSQLISYLKNFNKRFRKDFVHHVFFISDERLKQAEIDFRDYSHTEEAQAVIDGLSSLSNEVLRETRDLIKRHK